MSSSVVLTLTRLFQVLFLVLNIKLLTYFLTLGEVGQYYLIHGIVSFFGFFFIGPVGQFINRNFHLWQRTKSLRTHFFLYVIYVLAASVVICPLLIFITDYFGFFKFTNLGQLFFLIPVVLILNSLTGTFFSLFNMNNRQVYFSISVIASLFFGILFCIFFKLMLQDKLNSFYWILGQNILGPGIGIFFALIAWRKITEGEILKFSNREFIKLLKKVLNFSSPLIIVTLAGWFLGDSYRFAVARISGTDSLAVIAIGFAISSGIFLSLDALIQQIFYPGYYSSLENLGQENLSIGNKTALKSMIEKILPALVLISFFVITLAPFLVKIFSKSEYRESFKYIVIGVMIHFFRIYSNVLSLYFHGENKTNNLLVPNLLMLVFFLLGTFLYSLRVFGAEYYLTFCALSYFFLCLYLNKLIFKDILILKHRDNMSLCWGLPFLINIYFWNKVLHFYSTLFVVSLSGLYLLVLSYFYYRNLKYYKIKRI